MTFLLFFLCFNIAFHALTNVSIEIFMKICRYSKMNRIFFSILLQLCLIHQADASCGEDCTLVLSMPLPNSIFRVGMVSVIFYSHGSDCNHTAMWVDVEIDEADVIPRQGGFRPSDNFTLPIDTVGRHELILSLTCATPGVAGGDVIVSQASSSFQVRLQSQPVLMQDMANKCAFREHRRDQHTVCCTAPLHAHFSGGREPFLPAGHENRPWRAQRAAAGGGGGVGGGGGAAGGAQHQDGARHGRVRKSRPAPPDG